MKQTGRDCHVRMLTRVLQSCPHHHHRHPHTSTPPAAVAESAINLPGATRETRGRVSAAGSKSSLRLSVPLIRPRHFTCTFPSYSSHPPTLSTLRDGLDHLSANSRLLASTYFDSGSQFTSAAERQQLRDIAPPGGYRLSASGYRPIITTS